MDIPRNCILFNCKCKQFSLSDYLWITTSVVVSCGCHRKSLTVHNFIAVLQILRYASFYEQSSARVNPRLVGVRDVESVTISHEQTK